MSALRKINNDNNLDVPKPLPPGRAASAALIDEMRRRTNYETDTGYGPLYFAAMVEIPRLSSGAVCSHFLMWVGLLSYGRPDKPKQGRQVWTQPITAEALAELCRCNVRDIQRQLTDLAKPTKKNPEGRGLIDVKSKRRGEYEISPLYREWAGLPSYTPPANKIVAIDEPEDAETEAAELEAPREAVKLFARPQRVRDGRACRAVSVNVGVKKFRLQHSGPDITFDSWVDVGGNLVVSTRVVGEVKGAAAGRPAKTAAAAGEVARHPRAGEVLALFDPLLERWGSRLLVGDETALRRACEALEGIPRDVLVHYVMAAGAKPRASRSISGPRVVASIIGEAVKSWRAGGVKKANARDMGVANDTPKSNRSNKTGFVEGASREIARRLKLFGRVR